MPGLQLILASSSPQRRLLLRQLGIDVKIVPPHVDEVVREGEDPKDFVTRLALAKAKNVASRIGKGLILGVDTITVHNAKIMGKPKNREEAFDMIKRLSGTVHEVITGLCLLDLNQNRTLIEYEITKVTMKKLKPYQIEEYVLSGEGMGKAGGISIQERGASFIERIEGCFYNVVGLPLSKLEDMLFSLGYRI